MANRIVNQYHPEWKMNLRELNGYQGAMGTEQLVSSRKVRQPILPGRQVVDRDSDLLGERGRGEKQLADASTAREVE
jgi:hypothetical protein